MDETQEQTTARLIAQAANAAAKAVSEAAQAAAVVIAKENATTLTEIAVLKTEVGIIKSQQTSFETEMNRKMDNLGPKFKEIFDKLDVVLLGRPTWSVSLIITGLFGLCASLIVYVVSHPLS